jgi:hypothetical protein
VQLWRAWPAVQQVAGDLNFSEQGFQLPSMQGVFLGGPLALSDWEEATQHAWHAVFACFACFAPSRLSPYAFQPYPSGLHQTR